MEGLAEFWFTNKWLTWGAGPYLAANLGVFPIGILLEWYIRLPGQRLISWLGGTGDRIKDIKKTQEKVPYFSTQVFGMKGCIMNICGPGALIASFGIVPLVVSVMGMDWPAFTWQLFLKEFILMQLIGDLGLYWGHRKCFNSLFIIIIVIIVIIVIIFIIFIILIIIFIFIYFIIFIIIVINYFSTAF
jgi:hypothetical protein